MPIYPYSFQLPPLSTQDIPNDGAVGEFLGISAGGVLDWLPVASGGGDMLKSENLSGLASYPTARTNLGLGTGDSPTFKNLVISTGTIATSAPVTISQTWDGTGSTVFTALKVNATSTASSTASLLLDLQVGGVSSFKVDRLGQVTLNNASGLFYSPTNRVRLGNNSTDSTEGLFIANNSYIGFIDSSNSNSASNSKLYGEATNTLALRNGAAAQTFNVYGTYSTSPSLAYSRLAIACDTSGNATLTTQSTGTAGTVSINGVPVGLGGGNVSSNVAIGTGALPVNTTATKNIAIGAEALNLLSNAGSANNIAIGYRAGAASTTGVLNAIGNSILIGNNIRPIYNGGNNQIVIGNDAVSIGDGGCVLGGTYITTTALRGKVGIGTTAPAAKLEVVGASSDILSLKNAAQSVFLVTSAGGAGSVQISHANSPSLVINQSSGNKITLGVGSNNLQSSTASNVPVDLIIQGSGGNVGIGTTAPSSNLTVAQGTAGVGTISVGAAGTTITGVGTQFLNTFAVGQTITSAGQTLTISAIASDTSMTISPAAGSAISGQAYTLVGGTRFTVAGNGKVGIGANVFLERDGDNQLTLRNAGAAQAFRVYNTYTDASNYERAFIRYASGALEIGHENSGTGSAKELKFITSGVGNISFKPSGLPGWVFQNGGGHLLALADNTYDIGASGANRPRNVYVGTRITCADFLLGSSAYFTATANGRLLLQNSSATDFDRLQLGGTTNTFPAIARDGAGIKFTGAAAGSTSHIKVPAVAVLSLPVASTAGVGARAFVNDALAPVFGSTVATGGAVAVPVYSDGAAWKVG